MAEVVESFDQTDRATDLPFRQLYEANIHSIFDESISKVIKENIRNDAQESPPADDGVRSMFDNRPGHLPLRIF